MIRATLAALLALLPAVAAAAPAPTAPAARPIAAAVADPARPAADRARDADRKPAALLAFAGVRPGMTVVDMLPGTGYFTRLFARAVGPAGHVVAYAPDEMLDRPGAADRLAGLAAVGRNVQVVHDPLISPKPQPVVDLVWTAQNYHDLHNLAGVDVAAFDRLVFASLKPGGLFVVIDHAAAPGSGAGATKTLHRIDPEAVKREALAAGFVLEAESRALANPADDHARAVFDPAVRGHTDQFAFRFRKPS